MLPRSVIAALTALAVAPTTAAAQGLLTAQTPSRNIACLATPPGDAPPGPELRCDILRMTSRPPPHRGCREGAWGDAFVLDRTGPGRLTCHGDTTADPAAPVIAYGTQWRPYGFVCTSQTTGLTCVNPAGHGFSLSRASQKVF